MKSQYEAILFFLCLNIGFGLVNSLGLPGTAYVTVDSELTEAQEDYRDYFNATETAEEWSPDTSILAQIGDVFFGAIGWAVKIAQFVGGFWYFCYNVGASLLPDTASRSALQIIVTGVAGVWGFVTFMFIVEMISGRRTD